MYKESYQTQRPLSHRTALFRPYSRYAPLAGLAAVEGAKVGHLLHIAGACLGSLACWSLLLVIKAVKVGCTPFLIGLT